MIILGAFSAGFLAVGLPFWRVPYDDVQLPASLLGFGLGVVAIAALLARAVGRTAPGETLAGAGAAVPAAVVVRIIVEGFADPTSHNLAGIEVLIAVILGLAAAGAGVLMGSVFLLVRRGQPAR
jgi:hypothetical protein